MQGGRESTGEKMCVREDAVGEVGESFVVVGEAQPGFFIEVKPDVGARSRGGVLQRAAGLDRGSSSGLRAPTGDPTAGGPAPRGRQGTTSPQRSATEGKPQLGLAGPKATSSSASSLLRFHPSSSSPHHPPASSLSPFDAARWHSRLRRCLLPPALAPGRCGPAADLVPVPVPPRPRPMRRVVVTGLGAVTPFGVGAGRAWSRLLAGHSALTSIASREPRARWSELPSTVAGVVPRGPDEGQWRAADWLAPHDEHRISTFAQYAVAAADMALQDAGWRPERPDDCHATGVCIGTGIGNLDEFYSTSIAHQAAVCLLPPPPLRRRHADELPETGV